VDDADTADRHPSQARHAHDPASPRFSIIGHVVKHFTVTLDWLEWVADAVFGYSVFGRVTVERESPVVAGRFIEPAEAGCRARRDGMIRWPPFGDSYESRQWLAGYDAEQARIEARAATHAKYIQPLSVYW
jgi:hypothetical protein